MKILIFIALQFYFMNIFAQIDLRNLAAIQKLEQPQDFDKDDPNFAEKLKTLKVKKYLDFKGKNTYLNMFFKPDVDTNLVIVKTFRYGIFVLKNKEKIPFVIFNNGEKIYVFKYNKRFLVVCKTELDLNKWQDFVYN